MELTSTLQLSSPADLTQQITELCQITHLPGPYAYERQMQYFLGQALSLYQKKSAELQIKMVDWWETAYYHTPSDLLADNKWENFFPGVVVSGKPYRDFTDAEENTEDEQRFLTTQLLTGSISKKEHASILIRAQKLVCALDPREEIFFSKEILAECLEREKLTTEKAINIVLNRKHYTPIRKDDRRTALAKVWTEKRNRQLLRNQYLYADWEQDHIMFRVLDAIKAFTYVVYMEVLDSVMVCAQDQIEAGIWEILRKATAEGDEEAYYLDPRDEDTWTGLHDVAQALKSADFDKFYYDKQQGINTGQEWVRSTGLPALYGEKADMWTEHPIIKIDSNRVKQEELLVCESNRSPYEEMILFKFQFSSSVISSELWQLTRERYGQKLREVLGCAQ